MSTSTPKNTTENEEIDLGVLFNSIGRGISKLFNAIGTAILFVLNAVLAFALFVRKRILYFTIACGVGLVGGIVLENITPKEYIATATLEPHFDSARQLYSNVAYLNGIAAQKDSFQLASFFGITPADAATIKSIEISPVRNEAALLQEYNVYFSKLDSVVAEDVTYEDYVKKLDDFNQTIHVLKATSTKQDLFGALLEPLLSSISNVEYFKSQQKTELLNLEFTDSITQVSIVQTDSLLSLFEEIRIVEAKKEFSNGTNLYMSSTAKDNTEISLLNRKIELTEQLERIRTKKVKAKEVVDVIAAFPEYGYLDVSVWRNKKLKGVLVSFLLVSLFYLILHLDAFILSKNKE